MADFKIADTGTIVVFEPVTDRAKEWWGANVDAHEPWQQIGPDAIAIDHRPAQDIASALLGAGFTAEER